MFKKWSIAFALGVGITTLGMTVSAADVADDPGVYDDDPSFASPFIGTWTFQAGSQATSPCQSDPIVLAGASSSIVQGAAANEVIADIQGCKVTLIDNGNGTAKLKSATSCTLTDPGTGTSYNVRATSASLSLASNGLLTVKAGGTVNIFCSFSLSGTALK